MRPDDMSRTVKRPLALALLTSIVAVAGYAVAQQPPAASAPAAPPAQPVPADATAGDAGAKKAEATKDPNQPRPAAAKGSPQRFEPTEKVRPDFDVAFPVDI